MSFRKKIISFFKRIFLMPKEIRNNVSKRVYHRMLPILSFLMFITGIIFRPLYSSENSSISELLLIVGGVYSLVFAILSRYNKMYTFGYSIGSSFIIFMLIMTNGGLSSPCLILLFVTINFSLITIENKWKKILSISITVTLGLTIIATETISSSAGLIISYTKTILCDYLIVYVTSLIIFLLMNNQMRRSFTYHWINERRKFDSFRITSNEHNSQLSKELNIDPLTEVFNKRYANILIKNLTMGLSIKSDTEIVVAMFDIDHFKNINDSYGHDVGDEALKEVANTLKTNIRKNDYVIRYGGEEFLIFMTMVSFDDAIRALNKVRIEISSLKYTSKGLNLTMSVGVAKVFSDESICNAIKRADCCLYYAKQSGRDQLRSDVPKDFSM